jgi:hypothetical protein
LDNLDSDDGVTFARLAASFPGSANVEVTNTLGGSTAFVSMWIDFNGDGFFSDFERVANALPVTGPSRTIPFIVPATTTNESVAQPLSKIGDTYARIRLSTDAASIATATGDAPDGEVSDYVVTIEGNPYTNNSGITDEFGNGLDVSGDGFVSPIDVLQVINWINDENVSNILSLGNASGNPPYVDVNGDGIVSAADVNILITYLNSSAASGEGESTSDSLAEGTLLTTQEPGNVALVLGSDWMRGIENLGRSAKSSQSSVGTLTDIALLETEEETTEFADPSSPQTLTAIESFWVDLGNSIDDEDEDDQSSASDLASSLLSSR